MILTARAKVAGIIGWPVSHSRSPQLHGYWLEKYGIDGTYIPLPVAPTNIETALRGLVALGLRGANVTVPHKEAVLRACDEVDPLARRIGAVNTLQVGADGSLLGTNTDAFGFIQNLGMHSGWQAPDGPAVVLGAGGAARAACVALVDAGVEIVNIVNRTEERAAKLANEISPYCRAVGWENREDVLDKAALLVNTTKLGMTGQPELEIRLDALPTTATVYDIVYTPLETALLAQARARGNRTVDGLGMLLFQAQPGFQAWFGVCPEVDNNLRNFILADVTGERAAR